MKRISTFIIVVILFFQFSISTDIIAKPVKDNLDDFTGTYRGSYYANQGHTGLTLRVYENDGEYNAEFEFYSVPDNPSVPSGKYICEVSYNEDTNVYSVKGIEWVERPSGYIFADLDGLYKDNKYSGDVNSDIKNLSTSSNKFSLAKQVEENEPSKWADTNIDKAIIESYVPLELQGNYQKPITRSEFAHLILSGLTLKTGDELDKIINSDNFEVDIDVFTDTKSEFVAMAYALGIVDGYGNGLFGPNDHITREQAATMLHNTTEFYRGEYISTSDVKSFKDEELISEWAKSSVKFVSTTIEALTNTTVMSGYNEKFDPKEFYTKEQAIITIYKLLNAPTNVYLDTENIMQ